MSDAASHRASLIERRRRLEALLARLDADDADLRRDRGAEAADDEHDPEGSTLSGEWQRVAALQAATRDELAQVRAAIARADAGGAGICVDCGRPIPAARLEAVPHAVRCVECATRR